MILARKPTPPTQPNSSSHETHQAFRRHVQVAPPSKETSASLNKKTADVCWKGADVFSWYFDDFLAGKLQKTSKIGATHLAEAWSMVSFQHEHFESPGAHTTSHGCGHP